MSRDRITAVIAALPREVQALVRGSAADPELKKRGIYLYGLPSAIVVAAGMGASRVSLALEAALSRESVERVISTGLAGACSPDVLAGAVLEAGTVIDVRTGERFGSSQRGDVALVTADAIADVREKARLAAAYGAAMVDMEAATVARLACAHGIEFRAIKGISDAYDFELPSLARFADARGQFRTGAFALYTALRPAQWELAARLGGDSKRALGALHERLREVIGTA